MPFLEYNDIFQAKVIAILKAKTINEYFQKIIINWYKNSDIRHELKMKHMKGSVNRIITFIEKNQSFLEPKIR